MPAQLLSEHASSSVEARGDDGRSGDYDARFNDPEWLLGWLGSLAHLSPAEQIHMAHQVRPLVSSDECHDVIDGFVLGTQDAFQLTPEEVGTNQVVDPVSSGVGGAGEDEQGYIEDGRLWPRVWATLVESHTKSLAIAAVLLLFFVYRGLRILWNLFLG